MKQRKMRKKALALALTGVIAAVGGFSNCANAAVIEKSAWSVYYNSPGSNFTTDIAPITAKWGSSYTAKCSRYSGSISVSFSNAYISAASTSFSSTGSKKFTFANSASGTTQNIVFSINNVGKNIGSASGNVAIN